MAVLFPCRVVIICVLVLQKLSSKLNLVDLAGSERVSKTASSGETLGTSVHHVLSIYSMLLLPNISCSPLLQRKPSTSTSR